MTDNFIEVGTDKWVNVSKITAIVPQKSGPKYNGHHEATILVDGGTEIPAGRGVIVSDVIGKLERIAEIEWADDRA